PQYVARLGQPENGRLGLRREEYELNGGRVGCQEGIAMIRSLPESMQAALLALVGMLLATSILLMR
ncbi:MAG: hypothetical protein ACREUG_11245, partial [Steroidobacteraceae bacterium]